MLVARNPMGQYMTGLGQSVAALLRRCEVEQRGLANPYICCNGQPADHRHSYGFLLKIIAEISPTHLRLLYLKSVSRVFRNIRAIRSELFFASPFLWSISGCVNHGVGPGWWFLQRKPRLTVEAANVQMIMPWKMKTGSNEAGALGCW